MSNRAVEGFLVRTASEDTYVKIVACGHQYFAAGQLAKWDFQARAQFLHDVRSRNVQRLVEPLRDPSTPRGRERHADAGVSQHLHQAVDAEKVDLAPLEIADSRLTDAEELRGLGLGETAGVDELGKLDHQLRAHLEVLGLLMPETQVFEDVT
jgi:hypothetical protein